MRFSEARAAWAADSAILAERGIYLPDVKLYMPDEWRHNSALAMDAQPSLITTPNSGIPAMLTTSIDPKVFQILLAPNTASEIMPEVRAGVWTDQTRLFPTVERTGEVTTYGDHATSGRSGANANWEERQSYLFQTMSEWGELEIARAGLGLLNWVAQVEISAVTALNKFQNQTYFTGVGGLLNYGMLNDPALTPPLTPGTKVNGNANRWVTTGGAINASANEVMTDVQSLFIQVVKQAPGLVKPTDSLILAVDPVSEVALTSINIYGVSAMDLIMKTFKGLKIVTAVQYGVMTASNPLGNLAGNLVQLLAPMIENQEVGFVAYNEKLRAHKIIQAESSWRQKKTGGTWGAVIRQPFAIAQMLGV